MNKRIRREIEYHFRNYNALEEDNPWRNVIDAVYMKYKGTEKGKLMELRYQRKKSEVQICMELHISQRLYYDWVSAIINDAALMAAYEKLIKP